VKGSRFENKIRRRCSESTTTESALRDRQRKPAGEMEGVIHFKVLTHTVNGDPSGVNLISLAGTP
jgi:hypothetical protein